MEIAIVYMVAGISSRFKGKIKQLVKVTENETLIEYSLKQALAAGFTKIIFIVGDHTEKSFKELFGSSHKGIPVYYVKQAFNPEKRDRPWGTAEALCEIKDIIDCPFIICNGDDIYGENTFKILINHLKENYNNDIEATIGYKLANVLPEKGATHRAIIETKDNFAKKITETFNIEKSNLSKTNSKENDLCSMNIFALHPKTIHLLDQKLTSFKKENEEDRKIEFLIPNELSKLTQSSQIVMKIYPTSDSWLGITNPEDEETVRKTLKNL